LDDPSLFFPFETFRFKPKTKEDRYLSGAAAQAPAVGGTLPEIALDVPEDTELRQYLGLTGKQTFAIPEIKTEVVLIEIFSMY